MNTIEFQHAIDSGRTIHLPIGIHRVENIVPRSGMTVIGENKLNTILISDGSVFRDSTLQHIENVTLKNLTLVSESTELYAIQKDNFDSYLDSWILEDCDFRGDGIGSISANAIGWSLNRCRFGLDPSGSNYQTCVKFRCSDTLWSNINTFNECKFIRSLQSAVNIAGGETNRFINCTFEQNHGYAAKLTGSKATSFNGCHFEGNNILIGNAEVKQESLGQSPTAATLFSGCYFSPNPNTQYACDGVSTFLSCLKASGEMKWNPSDNGELLYSTGYTSNERTNINGGLSINSPMKMHMILSKSVQWNPPDLLHGEYTSIVIPVDGAIPGDIVSCSFTRYLYPGVTLYGDVTNNNEVTVTMLNLCGNIWVVDEATLKVVVIKII